MKKAPLFLCLIALLLSAVVNGQVITTVAGDGLRGYRGDSGPAVYSRLSEPAFVLTGAGGEVYVSDAASSRIRKIDAAGIISTFAGNGIYGQNGDGGPASAAQFSRLGGLARDAAGNIFVCDYENNRIRKISTSGIITTIAGDSISGGFSGDGGAASAAVLNYPRSIAIDPSGNIIFSDVRNYRIRKITTSGIISTIAGTGTAGYSGDGGPATSADIGSAGYLAINSSGDILFPDGYHRIRKISISGIISTVAGGSSSGTGGDGGPATAATLGYPSGVCFDTTGNMYIADGSQKIRKVTPSGTISTYAGNGSVGYFGDMGPATAASFSGIASVSADASGNIYIVDGNSCIRKVTTCAIPAISAISGTAVISAGTSATFTNSFSSGSWYSGLPGVASVSSGTGIVTGQSGGAAIISYSISNACGTSVATDTVVVTPVLSICNNIYTAAGTGVSGYNGDGGAATSAQIYHPAGIVFDASGNLYIADQAGCTIRKVSASGVISTFAGIGSYGHSGDGGPATAAQLGAPTGICFDAAGNMYIAEVAMCYIRKVSPSGIISSIAGRSSYGYGGDGGIATSAILNGPMDLAVDVSGNLYIADGGNNRIRMIDASGIITTIVGAGAAGYSGDGGPAAAATLNLPTSVAIDTANNLYITEGVNSCIRKVSPSGVITTIAGTGSRGFSGDGGPATAAMLNFPTSVRVDSAGNVFVADCENTRIRKISVSGIITTVAGNGYLGYSGDGYAASGAGLYYPNGITLDAHNNIYIADMFNSRVRKVDVGLPSPGLISGDTSIYAGDTTVYTESLPGGSWSASDVSIATIDPATGVLAALAPGSVTITNLLQAPAGQHLLPTTLQSMPSTEFQVVLFLVARP